MDSEEEVPDVGKKEDEGQKKVSMRKTVAASVSCALDAPVS